MYSAGVELNLVRLIFGIERKVEIIILESRSAQPVHRSSPELIGD